MGARCQQNLCSCQFGLATTGVDCVLHDAQDCASCFGGFELLDASEGTHICGTDNTPQVACTNREMNVIFLVDGSASVGDVNFENSLEFIRDLTGVMDVGPSHTEVAFVQYRTLECLQFTNFSQIEAVHFLTFCTLATVTCDSSSTFWPATRTF